MPRYDNNYAGSQVVQVKQPSPTFITRIVGTKPCRMAGRYDSDNTIRVFPSLALPDPLRTGAYRLEL